MVGSEQDCTTPSIAYASPCASNEPVTDRIEQAPIFKPGSKLGQQRKLQDSI